MTPRRCPTLLALVLAGAIAGCEAPPPPAGYCGDGIVAPSEACDDGNLASDDDCLPNCVPAICGDGVIRGAPADPADLEQCDRGGLDSCACDADCSLALCGDRHVNRAAGEQCDDGNTASADGCRADCRSDESCGNGIVDDHLPNNRQNSDWCRTATEQNTGCAEVCDDGNRVSGDGCSENCLSDETCGNGIRDPSGNGSDNGPEICDDGNRNNDDGCPNVCMAEESGGCGDGLVGGDNECDGGGQETPLCDYSVNAPWDPNNCTIARCGDNHLNRAAGEECDDGNVRLDDNCVLCHPAVCGDGATDRQLPGLEDCDLGAQNGQPGARCSATCTVVP